MEKPRNFILNKILRRAFLSKIKSSIFFSQNHFAICIFGLKIFWDHIFEKNHGIFISGKNFLPVGPRAFSSKIETSLFFFEKYLSYFYPRHLNIPCKCFGAKIKIFYFEQNSCPILAGGVFVQY